MDAAVASRATASAAAGGGGAKLKRAIKAINERLSELPGLVQWRKFGAARKAQCEERWLGLLKEMTRAMLAEAPTLRAAALTAAAAATGAGADGAPPPEELQLHWLQAPPAATDLFLAVQHCAQSGPLTGAKPAYFKRAEPRHAAAVGRVLRALARLDGGLGTAGGGGGDGSVAAGMVALTTKQRETVRAWRAAAAAEAAKGSEGESEGESECSDAGGGSMDGREATAQENRDAEHRRAATAAAAAAAAAAQLERQRQRHDAAYSYPWSPYTICAALAHQRGMLMARTGLPDVHSAGLAILRDCADGLLSFHLCPPPVRTHSRSHTTQHG